MGSTHEESAGRPTTRLGEDGAGKFFRSNGCNSETIRRDVGHGLGIGALVDAVEQSVGVGLDTSPLTDPENVQTARELLNLKLSPVPGIGLPSDKHLSSSGTSRIACLSGIRPGQTTPEGFAAPRLTIPALIETMKERDQFDPKAAIPNQGRNAPCSGNAREREGNDNPVDAQKNMESTTMHSDESGLAPKRKRVSVNSQSRPSSFCHVCRRPSFLVKMVVCENMRRSTCRKVVCDRCFEDYGWDWSAANVENASWTCPHCRGACPDDAQCASYRKTNMKRRERRRKLAAAQQLATQLPNKPASSGAQPPAAS